MKFFYLRCPPSLTLPHKGGGKLKIIGLTGGIGMGKSTLTKQLAYLGAKTCNADTIVHRLLAKGGKAVTLIEKHFPDVVKHGAVDRRILGNIVFNDKEKLHRLERILHPLVVAQEKAFVIRQARLGANIIALDIPLLFETGADKRCHKVLVAAAPPFLQRQRVLRRENMSEEKLALIIKAQLPEREKRKRADAVIATGLGKAYSLKQLRKVLHA